MTSAVGGNPLPESLSGPCRRLRYHELNTHKVTKRMEELEQMRRRSSPSKKYPEQERNLRRCAAMMRRGGCPGARARCRARNATSSRFPREGFVY